MFSGFTKSFRAGNRSVGFSAPTVIRNDTEFLQIWYDPSQVDSVSLNQGNIVAINGQGWASTHPANSTGGNRPIYVTPGLNGLNTAQFNGTTSFLTINPFTNLNSISGYTMFLIHKFDRLTNQRFTETNSVNNDEMGFGIGTNGNYEYFASEGRVDSGLAADTNWHCSTMLYDGTRVAGDRILAWHDNVQVTTLTETAPVGTLSGADTSVVYLGCSAAVTLHTQGQMAEIVFFTRSLTTSEVDAVNIYMMKKWGLYV